MKLNKKQVGLIAGVVCVILLTILLLTMCNGGSPETSVATTAASETTVVTTETVEEITEPSTEETTEETTETTEETTEATEPATGGNSGSSTGSNTTVTQPTVPETIPEAGSEGSPYYELIGDLPVDTPIDTVAIPVKSAVYYNLDVAEASVLTIENAADAYVLYQEKEYKADENGVVSLTLAAAQEDAPVLVQIGNNDAEERTFSLKFSHAVGAKENPHILEDEETVADGKWTKELAVSLAAGNAKGYHYQYTAAEKGTLSLFVKSVTGKDDGQTDVEPVAETDSKLCEIVVSVGEATYKLSESSTDSVSADMNAGDVAMIQIVAIAAEDGTYPALEALVDCVFTYPQGTEKNPICVCDQTSVDIQNLAKDEKRYYYAEDMKGAELIINNKYAYIQMGEKTQEAVDDRVKVTIDTSDRVVFVVGHNASVARSFKLEISHAVGSKLNPQNLGTSTRKATKSGIMRDYYLIHQANKDGIITFEILVADSVNWKYEIKNLNTGECSDVCSSADETPKTIFSLGVYEGDKIQVVFSTSNGQEATIKYIFNRKDKDASAVSETVLQSGKNALKSVSTATTTIYKFTSGEIGTYIFETDVGTLSYWGSSVEEMANATTEESNVLTCNVTTEDETVLIGVTGANSCNLNIIKSIVYGQEKTPAVYAMELQENEQFVPVDLTQKEELFYDAESGFYHLGENGPAVLVDFSSDTFVNLKKLVETEELYAEITAENGAITKETYNTLLQKYLDNAAVITVSQEKTATLYPLTEDLMYILKNVGKQFGWFDNTNEACLFDEIAGVQQDSLWMFPCCTVQTAVATASDVTEEQPVTDPVKETVTEDTATE